MNFALKIGLAFVPFVFPLKAEANDRGGFAEAGSIFSSELVATDAKMAIDATPYKLFAVSLEEGTRLEVKASSKVFHPIINIGDIKGGETCGTCIFAYDKANDEVLARMNVKQSGIYIVRINTISAESIGAFDISFNISEMPILIPQSLELGKIKNGELGELDVSDDNGDFFELFEIGLKKGQKTLIEMNSSDFDSILELQSPQSQNNTITKVIDDDTGAGKNARIIYNPNIDGKHKIFVRAKEGKTGKFQLLAQTYVENLLIPPRIKIGLLNQENLGISDTIMSRGDKSIGKEFAVSLIGDKNYFIDARSKAFDIKTQIGLRGANQDFIELAQDDDGGRKSNSFLAFSPEKSGEYLVRISPAEGNKKYAFSQSGDFTLEIKEITRLSPTMPQKINLGSEIKGTLDENGTRLFENNLYRPYSISLEKGQLIEINMISNEISGEKLDPFLEIGNFTDEGFAANKIDDDSGDGKNAKIRFLAPETKDYTILARTAYASDFGKFSLKTKLIGPLPPPPPPIIIFADSETKGQFNEKSPRFDQNALPYLLYSFVAETDKTYIIEANSTAFDIALGIKAIEEADDKFQTNDDGGGGSNAKITWKPKSAGVQIIRVYSNNTDSIGDFTLKLSVEKPFDPLPVQPDVLETPPKL